MALWKTPAYAAEPSSPKAYRSVRSVNERGPHFEKPEGNPLRLFFRTPATVSHTEDTPDGLRE
uniref:Uncharacterized protein n=1 Tax=Siphoviridae sp. ctBtS10 TaxID=2826190 RepID=A0A8S5QT89_9CAUD|nr:MAG TPA: hypothetical protein [Siphoviridae sp. ctBtS10]